MSELDILLDALVADPLSENRWSVLADWLEEHDDPRRAELLRLHRRLLLTCCEPDRHPQRADWQCRVVELLGLGVQPCVPQRSVKLADGVKMVFNFIPPGSFLMGSPEDEDWRRDEYFQGEDELLHRVTLTRGFWLSVFPVTQAQWQAGMGNNPSHFEGEDRPVEQVSFADSVAFCERLGSGFRLPTEAEWEYACRAGTSTAFYTGDGLKALKQCGWNSYDGGWEGWGKAGETKPVGQMEPNVFGLYDMHGNVSEWCADWYGPYEVDVENPQAPEKGDGVSRVMRGGSWFGSPRQCRSACRACNHHGDRDDSIGCRIVMSLD